MNRYQFTPKSVTKKLRLQLLASCLLLTLFSSTVYYLTLPDTTNANTTYAWTTASDFASGTTTNTAVNTFEDSVTLALKGSPVTDTTKEDFLLGGSPLDEIYTTAIEEQDDGEVVLNQGWRYGVSNLLGNNYVRQTTVVDGYLYVSTGLGLYVIDTKNTENPNDDNLVATYKTDTVPSIGNDFVRHTDVVDDLLYVSTWDGGLFVIDTAGTATSSDDTVVATYTTTTSPALSTNYI